MKSLNRSFLLATTLNCRELARGDEASGGNAF